MLGNFLIWQIFEEKNLIFWVLKFLKGLKTTSKNFLTKKNIKNPPTIVSISSETCAKYKK
jgi:hypothetical protein